MGLGSMLAIVTLKSVKIISHKYASSMDSAKHSLAPFAIAVVVWLHAGS